MKQESRYVTPDIGRGFMLLFIAVAHAPFFLMNQESSIVPSLDPIVQFFVVTFVDSRAFVMFSILFGFGLAFMVQRQFDKGITFERVKSTVKRRSVFLILFGFIHLVFIGGMDILAFYGFAGLFIGSVLFKPVQVQKRIMIIIGAVTLLVIPVIWMFVGAYWLTNDVYIAASYIEAIIVNAIGFPFVVLAQLFMYPFLFVILIGIWTAKKEWITQPDKHRPFLRKASIIGISVSVLGALPYASISVGLWDPASSVVTVFAILHILTGIFGGLGYTALIALLSTGIKKAVPKVTRALSSVGKRSLTFYIYQEALLVILLAQIGFGLGGTIGFTGVFVTAFLIWLSGCLLAVWLEKNRKKGPLETVLRRLVYKKNGSITK